jgi:uncharacterized protein
MQIQREAPENHSIRSYANKQITVGTTPYDTSVIVSKEKVIHPWNIHSIKDLSELLLEPILELKPDILIVGHEALGTQPPPVIIQYLSKHRIGFECMSIGAASRTFNVLLSEDRLVVVGFII